MQLPLGAWVLRLAYVFASVWDGMHGLDDFGVASWLLGSASLRKGRISIVSHGSSLEMLLVKLSGRRDFSAYLFRLCLSWAAWLNERFMICSTASRFSLLLLGINYIVFGSFCVTGMERGQGDKKDEALRKRQHGGRERWKRLSW